MRPTTRRTTSTLALALGISACATAPPQSTEEAFETYAHAMGSSDLETVMSLYTEDAMWTVDDQVVAEGRDGFRNSHDYELGLGGERVFHDWQIDGDCVIARSTETSEFFRVFGVDAVEGVTVFQFENGRIQSVETSRDLESFGAATPQLTEFFGWLQETDPDFCWGLFDRGTFDGNGDEGRRMIEFAHQWQALQANAAQVDVTQTDDAQSNEGTSSDVQESADVPTSDDQPKDAHVSDTPVTDAETSDQEE